MWRNRTTVDGVTIGKELADLRAGYPGCHSVIFADLSTGMVLASSTAEKTTQEKLDALCKAARQSLMGAETCALFALVSENNAVNPTVAWHADCHGANCYIKLPAPAGEAICIETDADMPLDRLCEDALNLLSRIAGE